MRQRSPSAGLLAGAIVIAIGTLLLLENLGLLFIRDIWRFWPIILIGVGVARIFESRTPSANVFGVTIILIGSLLLLNNLDVLHFQFRILWPLILIAVGLNLLWKAVERSNPNSALRRDGGAVEHFKDAMHRTIHGSVSGEPAVGASDSYDTVNAFAVFSGCKQRISSQNFQGGQLLAIFGGVDIDLRDAKIAAESATIDANALFGGIKIMAADDWKVIVQGFGLFGGYEDKTRPPRDRGNAKEQVLIITGSAIFGGVEIQN